MQYQLVVEEYQNQLHMLKNTDRGIFTIEEAKDGHYFNEGLALLLLDIFPTDVPIVDYGCGPGRYVEFLRKYKYKVIGIEGTPLLDLPKGVLVTDLTQPIIAMEKTNTLCLEVGEHIPKEFEEVFLNNITQMCDSKLVISWAVPGQGGVRHVNEKTNEEVAMLMGRLGFYINDDQTYYLRLNFDHTKTPWFKNTLMVFDKHESK